LLPTLTPEPPKVDDNARVAVYSSLFQHNRCERERGRERQRERGRERDREGEREEGRERGEAALSLATSQHPSMLPRPLFGTLSIAP